MRTFIRLVETFVNETKPLREALWKYSSLAYRSWYNPETKEFLKVPLEGGNTHATYVYEHPALFDVDPRNLPEASPRRASSNEEIVKQLAMDRGWIRVAGSDRNNPNRLILFEGNDIRQIQRLAKLFWYDMGSIQSMLIKCHNMEYRCHNEEEVKAFVMRGELPQEKYELRSRALVAESNRWANLYWFWYNPQTNKLVHVDGTHAMSAAYDLGFMPKNPIDPQFGVDPAEPETLEDALKAGWVRGRYGFRMGNTWDASYEVRDTRMMYELSLQGVRPEDVLAAAREICKRRRVGDIYLDFGTGHDEMESIHLSGLAKEKYLETGEIIKTS